MTFKNSTYDKLAWIGRIVLPSLSVLYATLSKIWTFLPYGEQIPLTITAIDVFLNALLGISANNYYKNELKENINNHDTDLRG